jgi:hypothetical protein
MPDLTPEMLPGLRSYRIPGFDLGDDFIYPNYAGRSILNLPASICRLMGVPELGNPPLAPELLAALGDEVRKVILVLMDALGLEHLRRFINEGKAPIWGQLVEQGILAPVTSITPSTTSAALTSLWTGRGAAEHGIAGYELWLKEYGVVANTIRHAPMTFKGDAGSLSRAGFTPENFLPFTTLGTHLAAHGVDSYALQHRSILTSGLSKMYFNDVDVQAFSTSTDLTVNLRKLLEDKADERVYVWVYWDQVDYFSHFYGPDDERTVEEFSSFSNAFERLFLEPLSSKARSNTLVILTADHGQIATNPDPYYDLRNHSNLARRLHILPTGEHRLMYLFVRPGQTEAVREYFERTWPNQFTVVDPHYAVHAGLFGPGIPHARLADRLGDLLVAAHGNAYLWWAEREDHLFGRHGGLSPDEMLVPLLAVRLY